MTERPILFSAPMVRALLDGLKTQTRRVVKPQPSAAAIEPIWLDSRHVESARGINWILSEQDRRDYEQGAFGFVQINMPPYGQLGDRLWVRESWRVGKPHDNMPPRYILPLQLEKDRGITVLYDAGGWKSIGPVGRDEPIYADDAPTPEWAGKGRPSIHMPRALSRILLEVTGVRVERLQDIGEADAIAEGIAPELDGWTDYSNSSCQMCMDPVDSYRTQWDSINGAGAWEANPWVWVVEFRRIAA